MVVGRVAIQCCDMAGPMMRYGRGAYDTTQGRGDTARAEQRTIRLGVCCNTAGACATTRPRYDRGKATIRPGGGRDKEPGAPRHGRPSAQPESGCAPGAPNSVLTQCTVLSHCLGHCS